MKKTLLILLMAALLVNFAGCNDTETPDTISAESTAETTIPTFGPIKPDGDDHKDDVQLGTDTTTLTAVSDQAPEVQTLTFDGYTATTTDEIWKINSGIDYSKYDFMGTGSDLRKAFEDDEGAYYAKYKDYKKVYYKVSANNTITVDSSYVGGLSNVGAAFLEVKDEKTVYIFLQTLTLRAMPAYSSVSGECGAYLKIDFYVNLKTTYQVCIGKNKTDTEGSVYQINVIPTGENGTFIATGKLSIPWVDPGEYWVNLSCGGSVLASVPITITDGVDPYSDTYHLQFAGDWDLVPNENYQDALIEQFYKTYPKLYARWGIGSEPKVVTYIADSTYDGVAYSIGRIVVVNTSYCKDPTDIGFFSHEITHQVQQYNLSSTWWTENMANYGGFRYHHWSDGRFVQLYQDADQNSLYDWTKDSTGYEPYGDGSKWFFTYLDDHWPTTMDEDGNLVYGLVDTINFEIKNGRLTGQNDNPFDTTNVFNTIVKEITGFDCMEDIRKQYATEFKNGTWDFKGFGDFTDNFLTENLPNVENPVYPMVTDKVTGDKTADRLADVVTEGENLCADASIYKVSGQTKDAEGAAMLIDGDPTTKWCSTTSTSKDKTYALDGTQQWVIIDLGEEKTFNTYTIFNTKTQETYGNMTEWELLISDDAVNWTSVDYQPSCNEASASFNIGNQSARYLLLKVYNADNSSVGTVRLYEFQLYNAK